MKPLENLFYKEQIEINQYKDKLYAGIDLLIQYNSNPDQAISEVLKQLKPEDKEYDVFYDVSRGLKGEYTRDRAIVLGKKNIVFYITTAIDNIKGEITELSGAGTTLLNILKTNIESVLETDTTSQSVADITKVLTEPVRKEYLAFKMSSVLDPKIQADFADQQTPESFMCNYLTVIQNTIDDPATSDVLKNAIDKWNNIDTDYTTIKYVIDGVIKKNEALEGMNEYLPSEVKIDPVESSIAEPYLLPTITKEQGTCDQDKIETFKHVIEEVRAKTSKLKPELDDVNQQLKHATTDNKLVQVLDDINYQIETYNKGDYTLPVLSSILEADRIALDNYLSINNNMFNALMDRLVGINKDVNLLDGASSLNREILDIGTV